MKKSVLVKVLCAISVICLGIFGFAMLDASPVAAAARAEGTAVVRQDEAKVYDISEVTGGGPHFVPGWTGQKFGSFPGGETINAALKMKVQLPEIDQQPFMLQMFSNNDDWMKQGSYALYFDTNTVQIWAHEGTWPPNAGESEIGTPDSMKAGQTFTLEFGAVKYYEDEVWTGNYVYAKVNGALLTSRISKAGTFDQGGADLYIGQDSEGTYLTQIKMSTAYVMDEATVYDISELTGAPDFRPSGPSQNFGNFPETVTANAAVKMKLHMPASAQQPFAFQILGTSDWMGTNNSGSVLYIDQNNVDIRFYEGFWEPNGGQSAVKTPESMKAGQEFTLEFGSVKYYEDAEWIGNYVYVNVNGELLTARMNNAAGQNTGGADYSFQNVGNKCYIDPMTAPFADYIKQIRMSTTYRMDSAAEHDLYDVTGKLAFTPAGPGEMFGSFADGETVNVSVKWIVTLPEAAQQPFGFQMCSKEGDDWLRAGAYGLVFDSNTVHIAAHEGSWPPNLGGSSVPTPESMKAGKEFTLEFGAVKYYKGEVWSGNYVYVKVNGELVTSRFNFASGFDQGGNKFYIHQDTVADYAKQISFRSTKASVEEIAKIDAVIAKIGEIPATVTPANKNKVTEARTAYDALNEAHKAFVGNLTALTDAEAFVTAAEASAATVAAKIGEIPATVTPANKNKVTEARAAYDALEEAHRAFVGNLAVLTAAEAFVTAAEAAAGAVVAKIGEIPATVTPANKNKVTEARTAYNELEEAHKAFVGNLTALTDAEAFVTAAEAAAGAVVAKIAEIPTTVTPANKNKVTEARTAYDALEEAHKAFVGNLTELTDAEAFVTAAEASAETLIADIAALPAPEDLEFDDFEEVVTVHTAYTALDAAVKAFVTNAAALDAVYTAYTEIKTAAESAAAGVNALIAALPALENVTAETLSAATAAKAAYDALTALQKHYAIGYDRLMQIIEKATAMTADKAAAEAVQTLIDALPAKADVTKDDKTQVAAARSAYDALTVAQKALVESTKLTEAESKISELEKPNEPKGCGSEVGVEFALLGCLMIACAAVRMSKRAKRDRR